MILSYLFFQFSATGFFCFSIIAPYCQPLTPDAAMLCFSCLENRIDNSITGVMVTTASPIRAFCLVPALLEML